MEFFFFFHLRGMPHAGSGRAPLSPHHRRPHLGSSFFCLRVATRRSSCCYSSEVDVLGRRVSLSPSVAFPLFPLFFFLFETLSPFARSAENFFHVCREIPDALRPPFLWRLFIVFFETDLEWAALSKGGSQATHMVPVCPSSTAFPAAFPRALCVTGRWLSTTGVPFT